MDTVTSEQRLNSGEVHTTVAEEEKGATIEARVYHLNSFLSIYYFSKLGWRIFKINKYSNSIFDPYPPFQVPITAPTPSSGGTSVSSVPLFSIRNSLSADDLQRWRGAVLRFELEDGAEMFQLDADSGELYMDEAVAFGAAEVSSQEAQRTLHVRVVDARARQVLARRVLTVRLVQREETDEVEGVLKIIKKWDAIFF